jgi:hypothetical protein
MAPERRWVRRIGLVFGVSGLVLAISAGPANGARDKEQDKEQKDSKRATLVLRANPPIAFSPARIVVTAELRGGTGSEAELYCPDVEWEWDDQTRSEAAQNCEPFVPGSTSITRRWTTSHVYTTAGRYRVYLRLKRGGKIILAGSTTLQVKPGANDMSEYER